MLTLTRPDNTLPSSGKVYIPTNALKTGIERDLRLSERAAAATPPPSSARTPVFGMRDEPPSCCIHQAVHREDGVLRYRTACRPGLAHAHAHAHTRA